MAGKPVLRVYFGDGKACFESVLMVGKPVLGVF